MKQVLTSMKRGLRHPSNKYKASNITTANAYERAEL